MSIRIRIILILHLKNLVEFKRTYRVKKVIRYFLNKNILDVQINEILAKNKIKNTIVN